jgi:DNA-binding FrmR family transcriptional regulator
MVSHTEDAEVVNSLKTARGQIDGILKMIDDERYCIDISKQIFAVQSLLKKANMKILKDHMHCCVADAVQEGNGDEKIEEIVYILEKYIDRS